MKGIYTVYVTIGSLKEAHHFPTLESAMGFLKDINKYSLRATLVVSERSNMSVIALMLMLFCFVFTGCGSQLKNIEAQAQSEEQAQSTPAVTTPTPTPTPDTTTVSQTGNNNTVVVINNNITETTTSPEMISGDIVNYNGLPLHHCKAGVDNGDIAYYLFLKREDAGTEWFNAYEGDLEQVRSAQSDALVNGETQGNTAVVAELMNECWAEIQ